MTKADTLETIRKMIHRLLPEAEQHIRWNEIDEVTIVRDNQDLEFNFDYENHERFTLSVRQESNNDQ